ncbi:hypothetical protein EJ08DRAFT_678053 [Tothia fuscella]|uniref:Uncharacterized protein n=1 Tax=Tothia fuscella TaxID=1048955 RepID=A0A9P4U0F2_9PEZI|nr:hypothetical protein EJ08DRAFT_678053 [Tothia fuscella]
MTMATRPSKRLQNLASANQNPSLNGLSSLLSDKRHKRTAQATRLHYPAGFSTRHAAKAAERQTQKPNHRRGRQNVISRQRIEDERREREEIERQRLEDERRKREEENERLRKEAANAAREERLKLFNEKRMVALKRDGAEKSQARRARKTSRRLQNQANLVQPALNTQPTNATSTALVTQAGQTLAQPAQATSPAVQQTPTIQLAQTTQAPTTQLIHATREAQPEGGAQTYTASQLAQAVQSAKEEAIQKAAQQLEAECQKREEAAAEVMARALKAEKELREALETKRKMEEEQARILEAEREAAAKAQVVAVNETRLLAEQQFDECVRVAAQAAEQEARRTEGAVKRNNNAISSASQAESNGESSYEDEKINAQHPETRIAELTQELSESKAREAATNRDFLDRDTRLQDTLRRFNDDYPQPEEPVVPTKKLHYLETEIEDWVEHNVVSSFAEIPRQKIDEAIKDLDGMYHSSSGALPESLLSESMDDIAPDMLLNALVTKMLYQNIIGNPFWFLDHFIREKFPTNSTMLSGDMKLLFNELLRSYESDLAKVHSWRISLIRMLYPHPDSREHGPNGDTREAMERAMKAALQDMTKNIITKYGFLMKEPDSPQTERSLQCIVLGDADNPRNTDVGKISMILWTAKYHYKVMFIDDISPGFDRLQMNQHFLHGRRLAENDARLDDRMVQFITAPGIQRFGQQAGQGSAAKMDYSYHNLEKTAKAWMGEHIK